MLHEAHVQNQQQHKDQLWYANHERPQDEATLSLSLSYPVPYCRNRLPQIIMLCSTP